MCEWTTLFSLPFRVACVCLLILLISVCVCVCIVCLDSCSFFSSSLCALIGYHYFVFFLLYSLLFRSNTVQNFEKQKDLFSLYVKAKYMFDQYQPLKERDNQAFRVYQELYVHNLLYDIPN